MSNAEQLAAAESGITQPLFLGLKHFSTNLVVKLGADSLINSTVFENREPRGASSSNLNCSAPVPADRHWLAR